jgi:hypothetical protein
MWHDFELNGEFLCLLLEIDRQIAETMREEGCRCGGQLDRADYPRKPRGIAPQAEEAFGRRFSFCCNRYGCRKRHTPMSVRFLGRRVYVAAVVVLACAWAQLTKAADVPGRDQSTQAANTGAPKQPSEAAETPAPEPLAPARTVKRWRKWWQTGFIASALWSADKGRFVSPVSTEQLPASLLERFSGTAGDKLKATLKWLSPLSTSSHRPGSVMAE